MESYNGHMCPRCGSSSLKYWDELDDDQKLLVAKLPATATYSESERRFHRFCTRCFFEEADRRDDKA